MKMDVKTTIVASLLLLSARNSHGYFGVSSRSKVDRSLLTASTLTLNLSSVDQRTCERVGVRGWGRRECGRSEEVAKVLVEAAWFGARQCQHLTRYDRWNCSLGTTRSRIMRKVFPETAFLQAMSAASVSYVVSRTCALGRLTHCSCGASSQDEAETLRAWSYGGCSDDLTYGKRFAERIFFGERRRQSRRKIGSGVKLTPTSKIDPKYRSTDDHQPPDSRDFKTQIDAHNARTGILMVMKSAQQKCKCHGASGSCTHRTCWIQLRPLSESSRVIKSLYDTAALANTSNEVQIANRSGSREKRRFYRAAFKDTVIEGFNSSPQEYTLSTTKIPDEGAWVESRVVKTRENVSSDLYRNVNALARRPSRRKQGKRRRIFREKKTPVRSSFGNPTELIYLDNPPNFCRKNKYGPGTQGRYCEKRRNCDVLCCGRGYDTLVAVLKEPCRCRVVWCCDVHCQNCSRKVELFICK